jgi:hypothetical protein
VVITIVSEKKKSCAVELKVSKNCLLLHISHYILDITQTNTHSSNQINL